MILPDRVSGPAAELADSKVKYFHLVAAPDELTLLNGIDPHFYAVDEGYWHVHIDNALGKKREGDSAGIAMGRIGVSYEERAVDDVRREYLRIVNTYEVPLVAQMKAQVGDQIYINSIIRFVLQLKQLHGFNITSFSVDGFQSAEIQQQLMLAGMVTAGMIINPDTGQVTGLPKPFSVDRSAQPYKDLLESVNEVRVALPRYALLRRELRELEFIQPGKPPDHRVGSSKDVADAVAGVIGYLSVFGHGRLGEAAVIPITSRRSWSCPASRPFRTSRSRATPKTTGTLITSPTRSTSESTERSAKEPRDRNRTPRDPRARASPPRKQQSGVSAASRGMKLPSRTLRPVPVLGSGDPGQGLRLGERRRVGRFDRWASSPCFSFGRPCDLPGLSCELVSVCVVVPLVLPLTVNRLLMEVRGAVAQMGRSRDRPGRPPRLLCGRDLRGR